MSAPASPSERAQLLVSEAGFKMGRDFPVLSLAERLELLAMHALLEAGRCRAPHDMGRYGAELAYRLGDHICGAFVPPVTPPDRLSIEADSPHYDPVAVAHVAVLLNGQPIDDAVEYCISEGWVRRAVRRPVDGAKCFAILRGKVTTTWIAPLLEAPKPPEAR